MFTEQSLRDHPALVKAFMGIDALQFWQLVADMTQRYPAFSKQQHQRVDRQREVGAGRPVQQPLWLRSALVLTYLRLGIPQASVAAMFADASQWDVSRELRRLLPLMQQCLPCPQLWRELAPDQALPADGQLAADELADGRALVDATEQRVSRSADNATQKAHYSGKKHQHTLKTQFVTDGEHHIVAISEPVAGATHDKSLSDELSTIKRLPDGCQADADKGYQGLANDVPLVRVCDVASGEERVVPRVTVRTPYKKPRGGELSAEQRAFNSALGKIRVRVEHCIGWVKNWALLAGRYRCAHSIYSSIMRTVCGFVNVQTKRWQAAKAAQANCA